MKTIVGNTVVRRLHIASLQLDTLAIRLSTNGSACSTVPDSTPEESDDDLVLQHRVTSPAGGGGSLRLHGRLAHPDWKLNPEAPSAWSFSLRRPTMDDSRPSVEKGRIGDEEVWIWQGEAVEAGSRVTLWLRLYLCSRSQGVCSVKRVRHEIEFVEGKEAEEAEIDLGLLF